MLRRHFEAERFGRSLEREGSVDDRPERQRLERPAEIELVLPAADDQPLKALLAAHEKAGRDLAAASRQNADQRDVAADPAGLDRLRQGAGATQFDDVIGTAAIGESRTDAAQCAVLR